MKRACIECGTPTTLARIDESGARSGYLCDRCERKRHRRTGWRRRVSYQLSRRFGI